GARDRPGPSAKRPARSGRALATLLALLLPVLWALAAHAPLHSAAPSPLRLPHVDPTDVFTRSFLERSASYDRFLVLDALLGEATLLVVLALYARRGHRLMRESAAGRSGTGVMRGLLRFAVVLLAEIPFGLAAVWWERRHGISRQGYLDSLVESFISLVSRFLLVAYTTLVAIA